MRLVVDLQGAQTGSRFRGIGRYSLSLVKALARGRGTHEVIVALSGLFPETVDAIRAELRDLLPADGVRTWNAVGPTKEMDPSNRIRCQAAELIREAFLASLQPDIVLLTSLFEGLSDDAVASIGLLGRSAPCATILYDLVPLTNPDAHFRNSELHKAWYWKKFSTLRRSDCLLSISESSRREALNTGLFKETPIANISGACDSTFRVLHLSESDVAQLWLRFEIHRPFLLYTGGADERKNLPRLIEAYAHMSQSIRESCQLVLAGAMPQGSVSELVTIAKRLGLARDDVLFLGYVNDEDLIFLYNTCRLFVFPSLHEGLGLPPLEAMSCGAPVVSSNTTSLPEIVALPEAMFDPHSVAEICRAMERGLVDQAFRDRLIANGKYRATQFSWEKTAAAAWNAMQTMLLPNASAVLPLLNIEHTGIFRKRPLRILILKLDHLGDFLLAIPAISKLRARYPDASIDAVVGSWNLGIAEQIKMFNGIYVYDFFKRQSSEPPSRNEPALAALLSALGSYDIALDMRRQPETRFVISHVSSRMKVAYSTFDDEINRHLDIALPIFPESAFNATPLNKTPISLQLIRLVDALPADPNDFIDLPLICEPTDHLMGTVAIFPKAGSSVREWPQARFLKLIESLISDNSVAAIEVYLATGHEAAGFKMRECSKLTVNIGLSFADLVKSLSRCSVCVANNSGGGHLASYLGVSVLGIYSGHELTMEWAPQFFDSAVIHRASECAPCHGGTVADCPNDLFCLSDISVEDVLKKTLELLALNRCAVDGAAHAPLPQLPVQWSTDRLVRMLLDALASAGDYSPNEMLDISEAIAKNHPGFSSQPDLHSFALNERHDHRSARIQWRGFSTIEKRFRWTDGDSASMSFECPDWVPRSGYIRLKIATLGRQRLVLRLNDLEISNTVESGRHVDLKIPVRNLESGMNCLEFSIPDAKHPKNGDTRKLGVAVRNFEVLVDRSY